MKHSPNNRMLSAGRDYGVRDELGERPIRSNRGRQMGRLEIAAKIRTVIVAALHVPPAKVTDDADLRDDLGADTLGKVEIALAIEDAFGIALSDSQVSFAESVGTLIDLVQSQLEIGRVR